LSASSAARTLVAVRGLHKFLALEGGTLTDPAWGVAPPQAPKRLPKAISIDEVERLLAAASLPDAFLDSLVLAGPAADVRERFEAYRAAGVDANLLSRGGAATSR